MELLVSVSILSILVMLLFEAVSQVSRIGQSTRAQSERIDNAAMIFDMMRRDLSSILLPQDGNQSDSLEFVLNPPTARGVPATLQKPHAFFWQSAVAANLSHGDIAIVGYFIRQDSASTPARSTLCRLQIDPADGPALYLIDREADWLAATSGSVLDTVAPAASPEYKGLLAEGILALWIRAVDRHGGFHYTWSSRSPPVAGEELPRALEIALVMVDQQAAANLSSLPNPIVGTDANAMNQELDTFIDSLPVPIQQGARIFRTTFLIPNGRGVTP